MAFTTLESKEKLQARVEKATRQKLRGKSESEIQKELEKVFATLKAGPRTYAEYESASYEVKSYWEFAQSAAVDKVLQEHKDERKKALDNVKTRVQQMWAGGASEDESKAAWATLDKFIALYPQVIPGDDVTGEAFQKYMRVNGLDLRELSSWETTLQALAVQGEIILSPKRAGIGPEEQIGGYQLKSYPNLHLLLRRAPDEATRKFKEAYRPELSADDFKKEYLRETDTPQWVKSRVQQAANTLVGWHPDFICTDGNIDAIVAWISENKMKGDLNGFEAAYQALSKAGKLELKSGAITHAGEMTMTNYEPHQNQGEPEAPGKLRAKVARMSSSEMATFLRENPSARKAIDGV